MTEGDVEEGGARLVGRRGDGAGRGESEGGEPGCFEMACDQTDRLVADRSNRYQEHQVGFLGSATFLQEGSGLGHEPAG